MDQAIADVFPAPLASVAPESVPAPTGKALAVPPHFKTSAFEGPLDLLLHLIRANKVDIYNIPIAEITQQYLDYMDLWEALDLTIAGEYVLIAATLIEIKSRLLLPQQKPENPDEESEDPRAELVQRLLDYQQYHATLETLRLWEEQRRQIFFRGALENADDYILPVPAGEASPLQLYQALHRLLVEAGVDERPVTSVTPRRRLSLRLKMAEIARKIERAGGEGIAFDALFELPCPRYDIVLTFLALLELLRHGRIRCEQETLHATLWLYAIPQEAE
jgi:segregation and condensation protein A